jgi:probable HAF family extracellular repeat protein
VRNIRVRSKRLIPNKKDGLGVTILFLVFVALASIATAQTYTVTDLGVLPGDSASQGFVVNSSGQVVGCADTSTGGYPCSDSFPGHAFLWSGSTGMQDLGVLNNGDITSVAYSITDSGQVTGQSVDSLGNGAPFLWTQSTGMIALPTLPGATSSFAVQANAHGIAGSSNSGANPDVIVPVAWIKNGNGYKILQLATLPGAVLSFCCSLNKNNQGVGVAFLDYTGTNFHGFLVKPTGVKDLGTLPSGTFSNAQWVNSSGVIAGYSNNSSSGSNWIAVAWDSSRKIHSLGTLPGGTTSGGYGINDSNQIVGFSNTATSASDAILWTQKGGMKDLNSLIPPNSGWALVLANSINNAGQITGYGTINGANHAFLLTPQ